MADQAYTPPTASRGDVAHTLARAGIASIPFAGNAAVEFFQLLVAPPLEKRRQEWCETIAEGLKKLESDKRCSVDELKSNPVFIDTVLQATQAAVRTSQQEKREALRNAVLNAALPYAPDASRQQIFINWVDRLTVDHLRMLTLLTDPQAWFKVNNRKPPTYSISSSLWQLLTDAYPEFKSERSLCDKLAKDLHNEGLLGIDGLHTMMTGSGAFAQRASELGTQFIRFISEPTG